MASIWQRPPQQTTKNCIAIFTRNLFCGNIVKVFGANRQQSDSRTAARTDRSAGTGCHVGDIWPNCALMCVCARVCVRHVCVRVCVLEQIANGKWPQMFYIFLFAACALISDCYITFHLMLSCSKDIKKSLSVCRLTLPLSLSFYSTLCQSFSLI